MVIVSFSFPICRRPFVAVALKTGLLNAAGDKAKDMGIEGLPLPVISGGLEMIGKFIGN